MENINQIASGNGRTLRNRTVPYVPETQSPVEDEASGTIRRAGRLTTRTGPGTDQSVLQNPLRPATTRLGISRTRMKWTNEINTFILRAYYKITNLETNTTAYRDELYRLFVEQHPNTQVTQQRIADQRRAIVTKNLIPETIRQQIRSEVELELNAAVNDLQSDALSRENVESQSNENDPINVNYEQIWVNDLTSIISEETHTATPQHNETISVEPTPQAINIRPIKDGFYTAIAEFNGTNPTQRHIILKKHSLERLAKTIEILNKHVIPEYISQNTSFLDLHTAVYCAAVAAVSSNGSKTIPQTDAFARKNLSKTAPWQRRLERRINDIRCDLGRLTKFYKGARSTKLVKNVEKIMRNTEHHASYESDNVKILEHMNTLKQKLSAPANRLRRYSKCTLRKFQNRVFTQIEKTFYKHLKTPNQVLEVNQTLTKESMEEFWSSIWS